jgi:hypothetical protein
LNVTIPTEKTGFIRCPTREIEAQAGTMTAND